MNTLILAALLSTNGANVNLTWESRTNGHYQIISASPLTNNWTKVTNMFGTGQKLTLAVPNSAEGKYYQVVERTNPFLGKILYLETNTPASRQIAEWKTSNPTDAQKLRKIADQPTSIWIPSSSSVSRIGTTFGKCGDTLPVFVLYYIYQRDNTGNFSSGGAPTPLAYTNFINSCRNAFAVARKDCVVVLEPDALAGLGPLSAADQATRFALLSYAVDQLTALSNVFVYPDGGHSAWVDAPSMASRMKRIGQGKTKGFALNVSNYRPTSELVSYGNSLSRLLDYSHYILDTSRNGAVMPVPAGSWCNVSGAGLGKAPTVSTGNPFVDAFLYIKYPGESDGNCNGGPNAGQWWADYALMLCGNAVQ